MLSCPMRMKTDLTKSKLHHPMQAPILCNSCKYNRGTVKAMRGDRMNSSWQPATIKWKFHSSHGKCRNVHTAAAKCKINFDVQLYVNVVISLNLHH